MKIKKFILFFTYVAFSIIGAVDSTVRWEYLNEGDGIHVIATSSAPTKGSLEKVSVFLTGQKFKPIVPTDLVAEGQPFSRANTIEYRTDHFLKTLNSDEKCIWSMRGGRGSSEIFADPLFLDPEIFKTFRNLPPKLFIGFSDFTAIHLLAAKLSWPSLHGVVLNFNKEMEGVVNAGTSLDLYFKILRGEVRELKYDLIPSNEFAKDALLDSSIIGGNLSLLQRSVGTLLYPNTKGNILFIEDTGEVGSKLHEVLVHIERAGLFDNPVAVIWGNFQSDDVTGIADAKSLFLQRMQKRNIPVFSSDDFGHGINNWPLPFGTPAKIEPGGKLIVKTNKD